MRLHGFTPETPQESCLVCWMDWKRTRAVFVEWRKKVITFAFYIMCAVCTLCAHIVKSVASCINSVSVYLLSALPSSQASQVKKKEWVFPFRRRVQIKRVAPFYIIFFGARIRHVVLLLCYITIFFMSSCWRKEEKKGRQRENEESCWQLDRHCGTVEVAWLQSYLLLLLKRQKKREMQQLRRTQTYAFVYFLNIKIAVKPKSNWVRHASKIIFSSLEISINKEGFHTKASLPSYILHFYPKSFLRSN